MNVIVIYFLLFSKKAGDLVIRMEDDDQERYVKNVIIHPNFYKTLDTLQDNIVSSRLTLSI